MIYLENNGPFHVLMGFSQGTNMVAKLCNLLEQKYVNLVHNFSKMTLNYKIELMIYVSSAPYLNHTRDNVHLYRTPSLHFIGWNDFLVDK